MTLALVQRGGPSVLVWFTPMPARPDGSEAAPGLWADALREVPGATVVGGNAHGRETLTEILTFAMRSANLRDAELMGLMGFSAGCQRVRELRLAGAEALFWGLVDGAHASAPPLDWQIRYGLDLAERARGKQTTLVLSHGYIQPPGYMAAVDYARRITGLPLPRPAPGQLVRTAGGGDLHVYSYGGDDAASHRWQGRNMPAIMLREHARHLVRPGPVAPPSSRVFAGAAWLDLEGEYVPRVVAGEMPSSAAREALRAQAIAARTYVLRAMRDDPRLGTEAKPIASSQGFQVMAERPTAPALEAAASTRGVVATWAGQLVICNYVAGAYVVSAPEAPHGYAFGKDPTGTQKWVTVNVGRRGDAVQKTRIAGQRPDNRGCMSQNLAMWLADRGATAPVILRHFYGEDLELAGPARRRSATSSSDEGIALPLFLAGVVYAFGKT